MPYNSSRIDTLHAGNSYTILDPGGTENYPNSCISTLKLVSDSGTAITISGTMHLEYGYDFLKIYDGNETNGFLFDTYSGVRAINDTARTGTVTLKLTTNYATSFYGFSFTVNVCSLSDEDVRNDTVTMLTPNSATLTWNAGTANSWTMRYGTSPQELSCSITTSTPSATLNNLIVHTTYYYSVAANPPSGTETSCPAKVKTFRTTCDEPQGHCLNYSNLSSCYVSGTLGTFNNPRQLMGIIDFGSDSIQSRHTVHTDTSETDPRTGNQLHTVPQGYSSSVRLGNWGIGAEAESITYGYTVDTTVNDLLIMKYAALLQVPNHSSDQRPRFSFMILDEEGEEINNSCYSADFIASTDLGWNVYDPYASSSPNHLTDKAVLWKDWTTVGIDLAPLHGETIFIRLTTRDCAHGEHYGYAYFLFDCSNKTLTSENCGCHVENTFTAPDGFSYRWYRADTPTTTLSTERSLHVTQAGVYRCQLSFVGAPAGASCSFEMRAIAGERYPEAIIGLDTTHTGNCQTRINLHDNSVIASDSARQQLTDFPCEERVWFVDGEFLSNNNEASIILSPGTHTIQLVASLAGGSCSDTATLQLVIPDLNSDTIIRDTIVENQLPYTFVFQDSGFMFQEAVTSHEFRGVNRVGCDSTIHYSLHVWPNVYTSLDSTICDTELPFSWHGYVVNDLQSDTNIAVLQSGAQSSIFNFQFSIFNSHGADSTVSMTLHVKPSSDTIIRDTIVENQLPYTFMFQDSSFMFQGAVANHEFMGLNTVGCDSTIHYSLHVWPNVYTALDSTICDTELPFTWNGIWFQNGIGCNGVGSNGVIIFNSQFSILNSRGADSTVSMTLHVKPSSDTTICDTIVENQLPYTFVFQDSSFMFQGAVESHEFRGLNRAGCDSTIHFSLHVWPNVYTTLDSTICADQLPFSWHGYVVNDLQSDTNIAVLQSGAQSSIFNFQFSIFNSHGADSTVTLNLTVHPTHELFFADTICANELPYEWNDFLFQDSVGCNGVECNGVIIFNSQLSTINTYGCDSTVHLTLTVNPTDSTFLYDTVCDNQLPYTWHNHTFDSDSTIFNYQFSIFNSFGCDSTVTMRLTVHPTHHIYHRAVVCDGAPYRWIDGNSYSQSTHSPHIDNINIYGCDSIQHLLLDIDSNFTAAMEIAPKVVDLEHPEVRLRDRSESHSRQWFVGSSSTYSNHQLSSINYTDTARYSSFLFPADEDSLLVLLVARTLAGCIDSVWDKVHCDRAVIWVPNAITPDEPQNNRFAIISNQLASGEVWIYNRAGMLVAHFDAVSGSWDGTYQGILCPQATYTWIMKYTSIGQPRKQHTKKGTVTVIR